MARSRNIKPGFYQNETLAECDPLARILFSGLWCWSDRSGRMEYRPKRIKANILPYDDCCIEQLLIQLAERAFITVYAADDGHKYIQVNTFEEHQNPHQREPASTIPAPGAHQSGRADSLNLIPLTLNLTSDSLNPNGIKSADADDTSPNNKTKRGSYSPDFERFWELFPRLRRTAKGRAWRAWKHAVTKAEPADILKAVEEYAVSEVGRGQFVVMPATWLNGACWQDDRQAWNPSTAPKVSKVLTDDELANYEPR